MQRYLEHSRSSTQPNSHFHTPLETQSRLLVDRARKGNCQGLLTRVWSVRCRKSHTVYIRSAKLPLHLRPKVSTDPPDSQHYQRRLLPNRRGGPLPTKTSVGAARISLPWSGGGAWRAW
jgi:hypothetical protein